jgi:hypothetical protein
VRIESEAGGIFLYTFPTILLSYIVAGIDTFLFFFLFSFFLSRSLIDTCVQRRRALLHFLRRWRRTAVETNKQQQQQPAFLTGFTPFCFFLIREKETNSGKSIASWGWLWDLACQSVGEKKKKERL